ncbi:glycosyltransferase family 4 protein [bacterium]|nr:glycosyltransferase family 4 protein [bacterium]
MKISYFTTIKDNNGDCIGAISKTMSFVEGLRAHGHTIYVNWMAGNPFEGDKSQGGVTGIQQSAFKQYIRRWLHEPRRLFQNVSLIIRQRAIIKEQQPDVIFERHNWSGVASVLLAKFYRKPLVVETDAPMLYEYLNFYGKSNVHLPCMPRILEKLTLNKANAIFAISSVLKKHLVDTYALHGDKIHVISNGANPELFYPRDRDPQIVSRYNLENKLVVGWIGSSITWSGFEKLVEVARLSLLSNKDICFMFVGGISEDVFRNQGMCDADIREGVKLPGMVPHEQLNDYLSCMDIVLAPYPKLDFWWASSMKVFEYMCAAKPVITTDVGQLNEIIEHGRNGMLLRGQDTAELMENLKILIDDDEMRRRIGANARETIIDKYSWERLSKTMSDVFKDVLDSYSN